MKNIFSLIVFISFIGSAYTLEPSDFNPIRKDLAEIKKAVADLTVKVDKIAEKVDKLVESPRLAKDDSRGKNCPNGCKCDSGGECKKDSNGNCICNVTPVQSVVTAYKTERVCDGETCRTVQVPVYTTTLKNDYEVQPPRVYTFPAQQQYPTAIQYDCTSGSCGASQRFISLSDGPVRRVFRGIFSGCGG